MTADGETRSVPPARERRVTGEQRRYNRRAPASEAPPPYYDAFDRIASALERIEGHLAALARGDAAPPPGRDGPPAPRRRKED